MIGKGFFEFLKSLFSPKNIQPTLFPLQRKKGLKKSIRKHSLKKTVKKGSHKVTPSQKQMCLSEKAGVGIKKEVSSRAHKNLLSGVGSASASVPPKERKK